MSKRNATDTKSYGLYITTKEDMGVYGEHDLTITLHVVSIENGYKIRNLSRFHDELLADFAVKVFVSEKYATVSAEPGFYDCHHVTARDAKRMATVYAKLEKGCRKLDETLGYAQDYGSQVARVALALGIKQIVRVRDTRGSSSYDDQGHQFFSIGQGVSVLNRIVEDFRVKYPLPVQNAPVIA